MQLIVYRFLLGANARTVILLGKSIKPKHVPEVLKPVHGAVDNKTHLTVSGKANKVQNVQFTVT